MANREALETHLAVPNDSICTRWDTPYRNPEDGIDSNIENALKYWRLDARLDTWEVLWQTLFPCDDQNAIPDPTHMPPVELDEVQANFHSGDYRGVLKGRLSARGLSIPESEQDTIVEICEQYMKYFFEESRDKIVNLPYHVIRELVPNPNAMHSQKEDLGHSDIPPPVASPAGFPGPSNVASLTSGYDTPPSMEPRAPPLAHPTPAALPLSKNSYLDFDVGSSYAERGDSGISPQATKGERNADS